MTGEIDYRMLLLKYIHHVGEEEGSTFITWLPPEHFTPEERAELERLDGMAVHLAHCNQGEYRGSCKYGDDDCPALTPEGETGLTPASHSSI